MERRARLHVLVGAGRAAVAAAVCLAGLGVGASNVPPAQAAVFMTRDQALAQAFPRARIEKQTFVLEPAQTRAVEKRAKAKLPSRIVTTYDAWVGDSLVGMAFIESRILRSMPGIFMVVVAPDTTVTRVDVLAWHEPPDFLPTKGWFNQFRGQKLDSRLALGRDIRRLAGATLSARDVTDCTRIALALFEWRRTPAQAAPPPGRRD